MPFENLTPEQLIDELTRNNVRVRAVERQLLDLGRERREILQSLRPVVREGHKLQLILQPNAKVPTLLEIERSGIEVEASFKPLFGPDALEWPPVPTIEVIDNPDEVILASRDVALKTAARDFEPHPSVDIQHEVA